MLALDPAAGQEAGQGPRQLIVYKKPHGVCKTGWSAW
jgi:hypothetical protein